MTRLQGIENTRVREQRLVGFCLIEQYGPCEKGVVLPDWIVSPTNHDRIPSAAATCISYSFPFWMTYLEGRPIVERDRVNSVDHIATGDKCSARTKLSDGAAST